MPKSLRTFLEDCQREIPSEVVRIGKEVDPAHYDVTAIIKHLGGMKKFPILIFEKPLNLHGQALDAGFGIRLGANAEFQVHSQADEEHSDMFLDDLEKFATGEKEALTYQAAKESMELLTIFRAGIANAMEKLS